jgi:hypothetical protein
MDRRGQRVSSNYAREMPSLMTRPWPTGMNAILMYGQMPSPRREDYRRRQRCADPRRGRGGRPTGTARWSSIPTMLTRPSGSTLGTIETGPHRRRLLTIGGGGLTFLGSRHRLRHSWRPQVGRRPDASDHRAPVRIYLNPAGTTATTPFRQPTRTPTTAISRRETRHGTHRSPVAGNAPPLVSHVSHHARLVREPDRPRHLRHPAGSHALCSRSRLSNATVNLRPHPVLRSLKTLSTQVASEWWANAPLIKPAQQGPVSGRPSPSCESLFPHNDETSTWQAGGSEGAPWDGVVGWAT